MQVYASVHDFSEEAIEILKPHVSSLIVRKPGPRPNEDELCELVKTYDILIIGIREIMTPKVHSQISSLRILATLSIGVDHIDKSFFDDKGLQVINCPDSNVVSVAEHTFALALAHYKKLFSAHSATLKGEKLSGYPRDLYDKTLGVIGAGKIGRRVMELGRAFSMKVLCFTFHPEKHQDLLSKGIEFASLEDIFNRSEMVSVHLPFSNQSKELISEKLINSMKKDAVLINTSRMPIINNSALLKALNNNQIMGAGLDGDFEANDLEKYSSLSNIIVTPHIAGPTLDANLRMDGDLARHLVELIENHK